MADKQDRAESKTEMYWTIAFIVLSLGLIILGLAGGALMHSLLAIASLILVIQLLSEGAIDV